MISDDRHPDGPFVLRSVGVPQTFLGAGRSDGSGRVVPVDIGIESGRIAFVEPVEARTPAPWRDVDCARMLAMPCYAEPHAHLDSTQICDRTPNPDGSFAGAASAMVDDRETHWSPDDMRRRMEFGLGCAYAYGVSAMRTHLASQNDQIEQRWEIFGDLRAEWRGRIELQAVPLIAIDALTGDEAALERVLAVVQRHDGVLGAFAPMSADIDARLERLFDAAESHGLALDFHADETTAPESDVLRRIAAISVERGNPVPITVGHCCSLSAQDDDAVSRTLDLVERADITIVSLPSCNLYLQDRLPGRTPRLRGVTLLHEIAARGIPVCIGGDNCRDPFHRYGDFNPLESFREGVKIAHLDHPLGDWVRSVTTTPAALIGQAQWIQANDPADLVLYDAASLDELLVRPWSSRRLVRHGQFVPADPPHFRELDR